MCIFIINDVVYNDSKHDYNEITFMMIQHWTPKRLFRARAQLLTDLQYCMLMHLNMQQLCHALTKNADVTQHRDHDNRWNTTHDQNEFDTVFVHPLGRGR